MPIKLRDSMSSEVHINHAQRHVHRCKQTNGAGILADNILPLITKLEDQTTETKKIRLIQDNTHDDLIFNAGALSDRFRSISDAAKQYDRDNPGRPVHKLLFPEGGYGVILRFAFEKKADRAEELKERLKSLGEDHTLATQIPPLENAIKKVRESLSAILQAKTNVRSAIANEEVAQEALRKQYEFNYLDAIKMFGKTYANRLFPQASKKKVEETINTTEE